MDGPSDIELGKISTPGSSDLIQLTLGTDLLWTRRVLHDIPSLDSDDSIDSGSAFLTTPAATLLLFEGLDIDLQSRLSATYPSIPKEFFEFHGNETISLSQKRLEDETLFFAKWLKKQNQEEEVYKVDRQIERGRPYDIDTDQDPHDSYTDHCRYSRASTPYRTYNALGDVQGGVILTASCENASMWFTELDQGKKVLGILLFDPPRQIKATTRKYKLLNLWRGKGYGEKESVISTFVPTSSTRDEFIDRVQAADITTAWGNIISTGDIADGIGLSTEHISAICKLAIAELAAADESDVLDRLGQAVDRIELLTASDNTVGSMLHRFRTLFGGWRNTLFHQSQSFVHLRDSISAADSPHGHDTRHGKNRPMVKDVYQMLDDIRDEIELLRDRLDGAFKMLMSLMSIAESERAIQEAEVVTKLTSLAFFFIPLTFVAGVFGMNVVEFEGKLTAWLWIVSSILLATVTYVILHWADISLWLSGQVTWAQIRSIRSLSLLAVPWLHLRQGLKRPGKPIVVIFLAVMVVGSLVAITVAWKITTSRAASSGSSPTSTLSTPSAPSSSAKPKVKGNHAPCYDGDGKIQTDYYPCIEYGAPVSACCPAGWTCLSNALCVTTTPSEFLSYASTPLGSVIRAACTNPIWSTAICGEFCLQKPATEGADKNASGQLVYCGDDSFCCGAQFFGPEKSCDCNSKKGTVNIPPGLPMTIIGVEDPTTPISASISVWSAPATTIRAA